MRKIILGAVIVAGWRRACAGPCTPRAPASSEIRERLENANLWRDHVMVVAHRGGGMEDGRTPSGKFHRRRARHAIELGVEMVELDIQKSKDGEFVVFHDSWLDRSSTCKGELAQRTLAELKQCRLVIEGTGAATERVVPTLREMLAVTRDRILVNIDNKLDVEALPALSRWRATWAWPTRS